MKTALFYGTTTGNTGDIAEKVKAQWDVSDIDLFDVADTSISTAADYDLLIFAIPTSMLRDRPSLFYEKQFVLLSQQ